jgi:hypothetical protein
MAEPSKYLQGLPQPKDEDSECEQRMISFITENACFVVKGSFRTDLTKHRSSLSEWALKGLGRKQCAAMEGVLHSEKHIARLRDTYCLSRCKMQPQCWQTSAPQCNTEW